MPVLNLNVREILIFRERHGADKISLMMEDLPSAVYTTEKETLVLRFDAARGTGEQYCRDNFPGLPFDVIIMESQTPRFSDK